MTAGAVELVIERLTLRHPIGILLIRAAPYRGARHSHRPQRRTRLELGHSAGRIRGSRRWRIEPACLAFTGRQRKESKRTCRQQSERSKRRAGGHELFSLLLRATLPRGTRYWSRIFSISARLENKSRSSVTRRASSPFRTASEIANSNGKRPSSGTGVSLSGTADLSAKNPARGPHTTAMSTSPRDTASTMRAGGFGLA